MNVLCICIHIVDINVSKQIKVNIYKKNTGLCGYICICMFVVVVVVVIVVLN